MNAIAISERIWVPIAITARAAGRFAVLWTIEFTSAVWRMWRATTPSTPATTIENPTDISVRRLRPRARPIASAHSTGTRIENSSARWRMAFPRSWTRLIWLDLNTVTVPMLDGSFDVMLAGSPSLDAALSTIEVRSSVTAPLFTATGPLPPSTIAMNSWSALRLAFAQSAWNLGLPRAVLTPRTAASCSAPASGAANGSSRGGSPAWSRALTSTLAYSRSTTRFAVALRTAGCWMSCVLVLSQLSGLNSRRLAHTDTIVNRESTVANTMIPLTTHRRRLDMAVPGGVLVTVAPVDAAEPPVGRSLPHRACRRNRPHERSRPHRPKRMRDAAGRGGTISNEM